MKLKASYAPHIRYSENAQTLMDDTVIVLAVLYVMAFFYYGVVALHAGLVSILTCYLADCICTKLRGQKINFRDHSAIVTGMILPLLMPAGIHMVAIISAGLFAIVIAKQVFGGVGQNIFNPAAAGFAFTALCFPGQMFSYPMPFDRLPILTETASKLVRGPAYALKFGSIPTNDLVDMLLGNFAGPMGATNILVILACLLFLIFRKTVRWQLPVSFLGTAALYAFFFPRISLSPLQSVAYELMSGMVLFVGVFVITDPVTSPKRDSSKLLYGIVAGLMAMLFRQYGGFEDSSIFAVLLMNAFAPLIDLISEYIHKAVRKGGRAV